MPSDPRPAVAFDAFPAAAQANLALRRPATQSSVSRAAAGRTTEQDAALAVDGTAEGAGAQTAEQLLPWWQVDLGALHRLTELRLVAGPGAQQRLWPISILGSPTGAPGSFVQLHAHRAPGPPGLRPQIVAFADPPAARVLRVRLDALGVLHLREFEAYGSLLEGEAAAAALIRHQGLLAEEAAREAPLAATRTGYTRVIGPFTVFVDHKAYPPELRAAIESDSIEARERALMPALLEDTDVVLQLGCGMGALTLAMAGRLGPDRVFAYERRRNLAADTRRNVAYNGLAGVVSLNRRLRNRGQTGVVDPAVELVLENQVERHGATVLVVAPSPEHDYGVAGADFSGLRLVLLSARDMPAGGPAFDGALAHLLAQGFGVDPQASSGAALVLRRPRTD